MQLVIGGHNGSCVVQVIEPVPTTADERLGQRTCLETAVLAQAPSLIPMSGRRHEVSTTQNHPHPQCPPHTHPSTQQPPHHPNPHRHSRPSLRSSAKTSLMESTSLITKQPASSHPTHTPLSPYPYPYKISHPISSTAPCTPQNNEVLVKIYTLALGVSDVWVFGAACFCCLGVMSWCGRFCGVGLRSVWRWGGGRSRRKLGD